MTPPDRAPLRIGYSTLRGDLSGPGDRRRFCHYAARRGLSYETARPDQRYDVVITNVTGDLGVWSRLPKSTTLVLDMVDAYLAVPRTDPRAMLRGVMKFALRHTRGLHLDYRALIEATCRRADAVVCATEEQRQDILRYCPNVHVILDFQTEVLSRVKTDYARGEVFNLVWEGLPVSLGTLGLIGATLKSIDARQRLAFHLLTNLDRPLASNNIVMRPTKPLVRQLLGLKRAYLYEWNQGMFAPICTACDLAVIPIPLDDPLAAGKPANKLILFWRMGLPVVTSATPAYARAMKEAGLEMTCRTPDEWERMLERYMGDEAARREAGQRGMAYANQAFSEESLLRKWDQVLASVAERSRGGS